MCRLAPKTRPFVPRGGLENQLRHCTILLCACNARLSVLGPLVPSPPFPTKGAVLPGSASRQAGSFGMVPLFGIRIMYRCSHIYHYLGGLLRSPPGLLPHMVLTRSKEGQRDPIYLNPYWPSCIVLLLPGALIEIWVALIGFLRKVH